MYRPPEGAGHAGGAHQGVRGGEQTGTKEPGHSSILPGMVKYLVKKQFKKNFNCGFFFVLNYRNEEASKRNKFKIIFGGGVADNEIVNSTMCCPPTTAENHVQVL